MTVVEKILAAASELDATHGTFTAEDLVVRAWRRWPETFGLQGYSDIYPDSNRVLTKIMGVSSPLRARGWLVRVGTKRYRITDAGRSAAMSRNPTTELEPERLARLGRSSISLLRRLLESAALRKYKTGERLTFGDLAAFWNISARSSANQMNARRAEADHAIVEASALTAAAPLRLPGTAIVVSQRDVEMLRELTSELETSFAEELATINSRSDERRL